MEGEQGEESAAAEIQAAQIMIALQNQNKEAIGFLIDEQMKVKVIVQPPKNKQEEGNAVENVSAFMVRLYSSLKSFDNNLLKGNVEDPNLDQIIQDLKYLNDEFPKTLEVWYKPVNLIILKPFIEYLQEEISNVKRYTQLLENDPQYLAYVLRQINNIVHKQVTNLSASLWSYIVIKEDIPRVRRLWDENFKQISFTEKGLTPLSFAAKHKNVAIFQFVLGQCEVTVEQSELEKRTCLHYATENRNTQVMQEILFKALKNGVLSTLINIKDTNGLTAIHMASERNDYEKIKLLISFGAIYDGMDNGNNKPQDLHSTSSDNIKQLFQKIEHIFMKASENSTDKYNFFEETTDFDRDDKVLWNARRASDGLSAKDVLFIEN